MILLLFPRGIFSVLHLCMGVQTEFPNASVRFDPGHVAASTRKLLFKAWGQAKAFTGMAERVQNFVVTAVKEAEADGRHHVAMQPDMRRPCGHRGCWMHACFMPRRPPDDATPPSTPTTPASPASAPSVAAAAPTRADASATASSSATPPEDSTDVNAQRDGKPSFFCFQPHVMRPATEKQKNSAALPPGFRASSNASSSSSSSSSSSTSSLSSAAPEPRFDDPIRGWDVRTGKRSPHPFELRERYIVERWMASWTPETGLLPLHELPRPPGCSLAQLLRLPTTDDEQTAYMWTSFMVSMEHLVLHYSHRCEGTWCPCAGQRKRRREEREAADAQHLEQLSLGIGAIMRECHAAADGALGQERQADLPAHAADDGIDDDDGEAIGDNESDDDDDDVSYEGDDDDGDNDDDSDGDDDHEDEDDDDAGDGAEVVPPVAASSAGPGTATPPTDTSSGRSKRTAVAPGNSEKQYLDNHRHREQVLYLGYSSAQPLPAAIFFV